MPSMGEDGRADEMRAPRSSMAERGEVFNSARRSAAAHSQRARESQSQPPEDVSSQNALLLINSFLYLCEVQELA